MARKPATVEEYLAGLHNEASRAALKKLRRDIQTAAPQAEECISYNVPGFKIGSRLLVSYSAARNHCAFHPGAHPLQQFAPDLARYDLGVGTIRFSPETPLPATLVKKLVKARLAERAA